MFKSKLCLSSSLSEVSLAAAQKTSIETFSFNMSNTITPQRSTWDYLFTDLADPRTKNYILLKNPIPVVVIVTLYLLFVLKWGPSYMKNRKPYVLKNTILIYNFIQILYNIYITYEGVLAFSVYSWTCAAFDRSETPFNMRIVAAINLYHINKLMDLLDTIFFTLRKKDRQITFLHLFHHAFMPITTWIICKYTPGGHIIFVGVINSFIHIILYTYYFLSAFGPKVQKYLWWKKYLTRMQLIQFCLIFIHNLQLLFFDCDFPRWTLALSLPNAIFFYYLFDDFYKTSYTAPKAKAK